MRCARDTSPGEGCKMDAIVVEELVKRYGEFTAVDRVSFSVSTGEFFGFLGPNGAGKTTTVRILTGIIPPDAGRVWVNGHDVAHSPIPAKEEIGVVPEMANVYIDLSAWKNLMLMGELYGVPHRVRRSRAQALLTEFGLWDRRNDRAKTLSKGMRQRLILAMALVNSPRVLFLDEPTSGLDVKSAHMIKEKLRELHARGVTIFLTTHNLADAEEMCHRVAIIDHGRIIAIDSPERLRRAAAQQQLVEMRFRGEIPPAGLEKVEGVSDWQLEENVALVRTGAPDRAIKQLVRLAEEHAAEIVSLNTRGPSLEEVFLRLTADRKGEEEKG